MEFSKQQFIDISDKLAGMCEKVDSLKARLGFAEQRSLFAEQRSLEVSAENHLLRSERDEYKSSRQVYNASNNLQANKASTNRYSLAGRSSSAVREKEETGPTSTPEYNYKKRS